jgi:hypothetical protein
MAFDDMGDETNGLMAEGSIRHEQGEVNVGLLQLRAIAGASSFSTSG